MPKGSNYSAEELDNFLDIINDILPVSATQWESALEQHLVKYPDKGCTVDSLKCKLKELHIKRIPTGDPHYTLAVCRAKQLSRAIIELMDGSGLNSPLEANGMEEGSDDGVLPRSNSHGDEFDLDLRAIDGDGWMLDTHAQSRASRTTAGSAETTGDEKRGCKERLLGVLFWLAKHHDHPQEHLGLLLVLYKEEEGHPLPLVLPHDAVLPLTLTQFQGPEIESVQICQRVMATKSAI